MFKSQSKTNSDRFELSWQRHVLQGGIILILGLLLAIACLFNPEAIILGARLFSWLPISGVMILGFGFLECVDGFLAKHQRDFYHNLHVGILDVVVGGLILIGVNHTPERLLLLIAAFLMVRGSVRVSLSYALNLQNRLSIVICGLFSISFGIMLWLQWPSTGSWFIALCLNLEIAFRGWATMMFGLWLKHQAGQVLQSSHELQNWKAYLGSADTAMLHPLLT